jgi:hypothetical protein
MCARAHSGCSQDEVCHFKDQSLARGGRQASHCRQRIRSQRQGEIDATVKRMEVDAATAEEKLQKLNQAGMQSWSALMGALGETRAAFDRANKAAQEAFKRAAP